MGGLWQALAFGFAGLRPQGSVLGIDPQLPGAWDALALRLRFRGCLVRVRLERERVTVESDHELPDKRRRLGARLRHPNGLDPR